MANLIAKKQKSWLKMLEDAFTDLAECESIDLKQSYDLTGKKVKLPLYDYPVQINIGRTQKALHIYPERPINHSLGNDPAENYIIFDPHTYYQQISGFFRLKSGDELILGKEDETQPCLMNLPKGIGQRHLSIRNDAGVLSFKCLAEREGSCIAPLTKKKHLLRIARWRAAKLKRLRSIFGGPIRPLGEKAALNLIEEINRIGAKGHPWRRKDSKGAPGAVVEIPEGVQPILIGDLHTKIDNLLVVLSQNGFLKALKKGNACLIFLGDAVHSEEPGELEQMDSSLLMMDLIFKLMLRFPGRVFYLLGNHDSFSPHLSKQGVPQGLLWEKALVKQRGKAYRNEMKRFYDQQPLLAYSKSFIACHAAPPTSNHSLQDLINLRHKPKLIEQLINNRIRRPNRPGGYNKKDVKRLRKTLNLAADTPLIVGHTPMSRDETYWEINEIENHCVLYASDSQWVAVMAEVCGRLHPFFYPCEPLSELINRYPG
ncbi:MAG: metallophosphoesterase [Gammaproteobacteria bacterium]|nr:metallophosphoesterase [Gammaproteobacteria bacterium]